jgi:hypothetical protein
MISIITALVMIWILFKPSSAVVLLAVAAVFQSVIAFELGSTRLWLYYALVLPVVILALMEIYKSSKSRIIISQMLLPFCAVVFIGIGSFVLPEIFNGVPVFEARSGMDYIDVSQLYPLQFTVSNIAQPIYIFVNLFVILFLRIRAEAKSFDTTIGRALDIMFIIGFTMLIWQSISIYFGIPFPEDFIRGASLDRAYRTESLAFGVRMNGSFAEPADLGMFAGVCLGYGLGLLFLMGRVGMGLFLVGAGIFMGVASGSTTAIVAMLGPILFLVLSAKRIKVNIITISVASIGAIIFSFWIYNSDFLANFINSTLVQKIDSSSFAARFFSLEYSLTLFIDTFGLGVGLGSHRPSSMIAMLIACLGIFCVPVIYYVFVKPLALLRSRYPFHATIFLAYSAILFAAAVSVPDMSHVTFCFISSCVLCIVLREDELIKNNRLLHNKGTK